MKVLVQIGLLLAATSSFAEPIDYFKNVTGHLTNFSSYPNSNLEIVFTILKCRRGQVWIECDEKSPLRKTTHPVNESGDFLIEELGIKGRTATDDKEMAWRFQVKYPDDVLSKHPDVDHFLALNRRSLHPKNIVDELQNLRSFRMPDLQVTLTDMGGEKIDVATLERLKARYVVWANFNNPCNLVEFTNQTTFGVAIHSNPFFAKGTATHTFEKDLEAYKNEVVPVESIGVDEPGHSCCGEMIHKVGIPLAEISLDSRVWVKSIAVTLPDYAKP